MIDNTDQQDLDSLKNEEAVSACDNTPIRIKETQRIWSNVSHLDEPHKSVLQNLSDNFGLEIQWLDYIDAYSIPISDDETEEGFIYMFDDKSRIFGNKTMVEVDMSGNVRRKYTTK